MYAERSPSWLDRLVACCGPPSPGLPSPSRHRFHRNEKDVAVWSDEPSMMPPPLFAPLQPPPAVAGAGAGVLDYDDDLYGMAATSYAHGPGQHAYTGSGASSAASRLAHSHNHGHGHGHNRSGSGSYSFNGSHGRSRNRLSRRRQRPRTASSSLSFFALTSLSSASSRRPLISAPTNFQHVHSGAFVFPQGPSQQQQPQPQQSHQPKRPPSFQRIDVDPLPSPLLSSFERSWTAPTSGLDATAAAAATPPLRAHTRNGSDNSSTTTTTTINGAAQQHGRSYSALSFHLPRRAVGAASAASLRSVTTATAGVPESAMPLAAHPVDVGAATASSTPPPAIPQRSRLRSHSSPAVESMVERIASAMIEMERLQAEIDSVVERQSLYVSSRPTTAYGDFDPLPAIPAMPAAAPSFAERLSTERPKTAPPRNSTLFEYGYGRGQKASSGSPTNNDSSSSGGSSSSSSGGTNSSVTAAGPAAGPTAGPTVAQAAAHDSAAAEVAASPSLVAAAGNRPPRPASPSFTHTPRNDGHGPHINGLPVDFPLAPPLPLVLRPPLRKKKSFSRVSTWLFQPTEGGGSSMFSPFGSRGLRGSFGGQGSSRGGARFDAVTNAPQPVTESDGFYSVMPAAAAAADAAITPTTPQAAAMTTMTTVATTATSRPRWTTSLDSKGSSSPSPSTVDTLSTWTTEREDAGQRYGGEEVAEEEEDDDDDVNQEADDTDDEDDILPSVWPSRRRALGGGGGGGSASPDPIDIAGQRLPQQPRDDTCPTTPTTTTLTPTSATTTTTMTTVATLAMAATATTAAEKQQPGVATAMALLGSGDDGLAAHRPLSVGVAF